MRELVAAGILNEYNELADQLVIRDQAQQLGAIAQGLQPLAHEAITFVEAGQNHFRLEGLLCGFRRCFRDRRSRHFNYRFRLGSRLNRGYGGLRGWGNRSGDRRGFRDLFNGRGRFDNEGRCAGRLLKTQAQPDERGQRHYRDARYDQQT